MQFEAASAVGLGVIQRARRFVSHLESHADWRPSVRTATDRSYHDPVSLERYLSPNPSVTTAVCGRFRPANGRARQGRTIMIDLKDLRDNPDRYRRGAELKGVKVDVDGALRLDEQWRGSQSEFERLRAEQN